MKFVMERNDYDDKIRVLVEIDGREYARARLQPFDRLLLKDCEGSDKASDKLLALETIVRRIEESQSAALSQSSKEKS